VLIDYLVSMELANVLSSQLVDMRPIQLANGIPSHVMDETAPYESHGVAPAVIEVLSHAGYFTLNIGNHPFRPARMALTA
jgi:hypothetical protein